MGESNDVDDSGDAVDSGEHFREQAEVLAEFWSEHDLDFTPESLRRLDAFVAAELAETIADVGGDEIGDLLSHALILRSNFAEVLVENHDAAWLDEDGFVIALVSGEEGVAVSAVEVAAACLGDERTFAGMYEELLAEA